MTATEDLFTPIHKALRAMLYDLSARLQTNDFADTAATTAVVSHLESDFAVARSAGCVVCVLSHHAGDEESAIFPQVSRVGERLVQSLREEHHDLARRELAIGELAHRLLAMQSPDDRIAAGVQLNHRANELLGAYLTHMNREDTELVPLMQEHFTDAQMIEMRSVIMGGMPPERLFAILGWMLPALNVTELSAMFTSMRPGLPPPVFRAISDLAAARVDPARWSLVKERVGIQVQAPSPAS